MPIPHYSAINYGWRILCVTQKSHRWSKTIKWMGFGGSKQLLISTRMLDPSIGSWNLCELCRQALPEEEEFCRGDWSGTLSASDSTPARKWNLEARHLLQSTLIPSPIMFPALTRNSFRLISLNILSRNHVIDCLDHLHDIVSRVSLTCSTLSSSLLD